MKQRHLVFKYRFSKSTHPELESGYDLWQLVDEYTDRWYSGTRKPYRTVENVKTAAEKVARRNRATFEISEADW